MARASEKLPSRSTKKVGAVGITTALDQPCSKTLFPGKRPYSSSNFAACSRHHIRFGDTAANAGILALLNSSPLLFKPPLLLRIIFATIVAALFRMILIAIDSFETTCPGHGSMYSSRIFRLHGLGSVWYGACAALTGSFLGIREAEYGQRVCTQKDNMAVVVQEGSARLSLLSHPISHLHNARIPLPSWKRRCGHWYDSRGG
jgi:hypothetical protein